MSQQNCPVCRQTISDPMSAVLVGEKLREIGAWDEWAYYGGPEAPSGYYRDRFRMATFAGHPVLVRSVRTTPADVSATYYSEYPQGTTFQAYVLFQIGDRFYRAIGEGDSYGDINWQHHLTEVEAREKTVTVYEVVE